MTTIYLIRHGEYVNPDYMFPGRGQGYPLSEKGKEQVKSLAHYFEAKSIAAIYSSSLLRTKQTAEILSIELHVPVLFDDRLLEVRTMLDGVSMQLFDDTNGELSYLPKNLAKGAETMEDLATRMAGFIEEKCIEHMGKEVLVVTHGDPMRYVVMKYMGMPINFPSSRLVAIPLAGGYQLVFDDQGHECMVNPIPFESDI